MTDDLGDRMKLYEQVESGRRLMPLLPAMARLDGQCFSTWTKGLERPYDQRLSELMAAVTVHLVEETGAVVGYTQSDEISLCWYSDSAKSQIYWDGKVQKMVGDLAARASLAFAALLPRHIPEKTFTPRFDCRVWNVPTLEEAANTFLWREIDATKNSVSMACREHYSHKQMYLKRRADQMDMLMAKGVDWNDYPAFFKRGTWVRAKQVTTPFTAEEIEALPPLHNARKDPDLVVERRVVEVLDMPPFTKVGNRVGVIFHGEDPKLHAPD